MHRHALPALLALTLGTAPVLADMPEGITHFTLPNGLETVVIEDCLLYTSPSPRD